MLVFSEVRIQGENQRSHYQCIENFNAMLMYIMTYWSFFFALNEVVDKKMHVVLPEPMDQYPYRNSVHVG